MTAPFLEPMTVYDVVQVKDGPNITVGETEREILGCIRPYKSNGQQADQVLVESLGVNSISGLVNLYSHEELDAADKATGAKGTRFFWNGLKYEVGTIQRSIAPGLEDLAHYKNTSFVLDEKSTNYEPPPEEAP